ncbi:MAG: hypothetical protein EOO56_24270 [Hymenobacter sp.]|nr:MAG: hypothetical protein EOO56_24270 [Hymenobacter sp.]
MSSTLPIASAAAPVPSTKAWLLLASLLTVLLVAFQQMKPRPAGPASSATQQATMPAPQPPLTTRRVALASPAGQPGTATMFASAATL